ncbi:hypothetical protein [Luteimonas saliphila]|uniref:hypothetical protein n=1 Tax=Luteimonas saliphila TaxID=2804919 RepID=UPI00192DA6F9|nr:hypothetical protein [Luteimonas saliphila]
MPISDPITSYSVSVVRSNLHEITRQARLQLESGGSATVSFVATLPAEFVRFTNAGTSLFMTNDQFEDVHALLRGDEPAFFTALDLFGLRVGSVHSRLADAGATRSEDAGGSNSLEALIDHARRIGSDRA